MSKEIKKHQIIASPEHAALTETNGDVGVAVRLLKPVPMQDGELGLVVREFETASEALAYLDFCRTVMKQFCAKAGIPYESSFFLKP